MAYFLGIDIGSGSSKGVITRDGEMQYWHRGASGVDYGRAAARLREELLGRSGLTEADIAATVTTGHGAGVIPFESRPVADMLCCARGINRIFPSARTIIDVQAQSSQALSIDDRGRITDFAVSETCATGSGSFIEVIANVLQVALDDIGPLSLRSQNPVTFTTGCAVFGESEAVSRVSEGTPREDILAGVHRALAANLLALAARTGLKEDCAISGGGGLNAGLVGAIEAEGVRLLVPPQPELVNALGAALIAEDTAGAGPAS